MPAFQKHLFICTNSRPDGHPKSCCSAKNAEAIREKIKDLAAAAGLKGRIRINAAGCLDQCEHGVTIVVYPESVWYGFVTLDDAEEIVRSHLIENRPVERLRLPDSCINTDRCPHRGGTVQLGLKR